MTRYELLDRIGVGGMAEIFRGKAVAAGGFEKPVAIKRILPHLSQDPRFVELLIAEAKILSLLKHRNIVQIFDVGLGDDGKYFLVMEYVDGRDLGAIQRGLEAQHRKLPLDLALHIAAEMCEALEHAHTARAPDGKPMTLVHRDVSPSNVLLSRAGEIKLTDFGIAKRAEQEQTGHGAVRGKFAYISPEQARNEHIDPRSDVFAVGILLWELICNRRLFSALPDFEALRAVREVAIQRPSEIDARLAPEIDELVMSALAGDSRRRPTAGELGAKLRSMRYAMDVTVGDPATELAKIIDTAEQVERDHQIMEVIGASVTGGSGFEEHGGESTVIRIRTADEFSSRHHDGDAMARAREVIDRFEEEETRLAQLTEDQMRILQSISPRSPYLTDEATILRAPLPSGDELSITPLAQAPDPRIHPERGREEPRATPERFDRQIDSDEHTRPVFGDLRTPTPMPPPIPKSAPVMAVVAGPESSVRPQPAVVSQAASAWAPPPGPAPMPPPFPRPENYGAWPPPPRLVVPPMTTTRPRSPALRPWMLIVGALIMAALAFAVTRACLGTTTRPSATDR